MNRPPARAYAVGNRAMWRCVCANPPTLHGNSGARGERAITTPMDTSDNGAGRISMMCSPSAAFNSQLEQKPAIDFARVEIHQRFNGWKGANRELAFLRRIGDKTP